MVECSNAHHVTHPGTHPYGSCGPLIDWYGEALKGSIDAESGIHAVGSLEAVEAASELMDVLAAGDWPAGPVEVFDEQAYLQAREDLSEVMCLDVGARCEPDG